MLNAIVCHEIIKVAVLVKIFGRSYLIRRIQAHYTTDCCRKSKGNESLADKLQLSFLKIARMKKRN